MAGTRPQESTYLNTAVTTCKKAFISVGILSFFVNILMLTVPLYMLQLFDRVLSSHSFDTLLFLTIIAAIALIVLGLLEACRSRVLLIVSNWLDNKIAPEAINRSADETLRGNQMATQSISDVATLRGFVSSPALLVLFDAPWIPIYLLAIFILHITLGVIALIGGILLFSLAVTNEIITRNLHKDANQKAINTSQQVRTTLNNAETIQAMGMMPAVIKRWFTENQDMLNLRSKANVRTGTISACSKSLRLILQIVMLGAGAFFVVLGQLTPGVMIAGAILLARALAPIDQSLNAWRQLIAVRQAYQRLRDYFSLPTLRKSTMKLPKPRGNLSIEKILFTVPGREKFILDNINFQLKSGEMLVIVGPSASGKTSLARIIVGAIKPNAGIARLDGADVYSWNREEFGKHVGYLPQSVELFTGTVQDNIARLGESDPDEIVEAAKLAHAHEMILNLSEGYNTFLENQGRSLSGGQRQRIALARAMYKKPILLVLDEPSSNLDDEGTNALQRALIGAKEHKATTILITHRPSLVDCADKILYIKDGKTMLYGAKNEILEKLFAANKQGQKTA